MSEPEGPARGMKFRKKPVVIEAVQWDNSMEVYNYLYHLTEKPAVSAFHPDESLMIDTLEGWMKANKGDWVIRGVKGELYPCKPDIFEATYEAVAERGERRKV